MTHSLIFPVVALNVVNLL